MFNKMTYPDQTNSAYPHQTVWSECKQCIPRSDCSSGFTLFAFPQSILRNSCIKSKLKAKIIWNEVFQLGHIPYYYYYYYYFYWWGGTLINGHILVDVWAHSTTPVYCEIMNVLCSFSFTIFYGLIFATLLVNSANDKSANDKSVIYFLLLLFPENKVWCFMQTVPGESLHKMSNLIFSKWVLQSCLLWKLFPFPYYWIMIPGS